VSAARRKDDRSKVIIGGSLISSEKNLKKATLSDDVTSDWHTAVNLGTSGLQNAEAKP